MNNLKFISGMIRFHRKKAGLSQKGLADLAGVGKTVVYDIEKGKVTIQLKTLLFILDALNIRIEFDSPILSEFIANYHENS